MPFVNISDFSKRELCFMVGSSIIPASASWYYWKCVSHQQNIFDFWKNLEKPKWDSLLSNTTTAQVIDIIFGMPLPASHYMLYKFSDGFQTPISKCALASMLIFYATYAASSLAVCLQRPFVLNFYKKIEAILCLSAATVAFATFQVSKLAGLLTLPSLFWYMRFSLLLRSNWKTLLSEAEKLITHSGSYSSLQYLLNNDVASVTLGMRKLLGSKHKLLKTLKYFLYDGHEVLRTLSATILLISDTVNSTVDLADLDDGHCKGPLLNSQCSLAEICEIIYAANFIHRSIVNRIIKQEQEQGDSQLLTLGNRMAVLGGDYLLANASLALANIGNAKVIELVSKAILDMSLAEIPNDDDDAGDIAETFHFVDPQFWEQKAYLSIASLLAHCCYSAAELVGADENLKSLSFKFAKYTALALALKLSIASGAFQAVDSNSVPLFPTLLTSGAVMDDLMRSYKTTALSALNQLPQCHSSRSLATFVNSINLAG
ncbi:Decaprenyl-diphosphate synthase subunit 2 [Trichinella pseudospiralis]|uniref:Decaprenyl-diphosphate synthase subunit 2 n=1 Tax=Trichinella pseudospiralis TaxID=6337 RepID=A0A0V1FSI3_TRIPS|nr:Decaprenyl-diphosphate synthase subunit 2 [Trichinella pseudospiralis]